MKNGAVIAAGGTGTRMGTDIPKQLLKLGGITILERTLMPFINCPEIGQIVIVAAESIIRDINSTVHETTAHARPITVVQGGRERQDSVLNGIMALDRDTGIVVIHDAVRPFITAGLVSECIHAAETFSAVSVMRRIKETVKVVKDGTVANTPDRSQLWITQTPQAFRKELIIEAHKRARNDRFIGTDDCMLVERLGYPVHVVEGSDTNIKITTPTDLALAGALLKQFEEGRV